LELLVWVSWCSSLLLLAELALWRVGHLHMNATANRVQSVAGLGNVVEHGQPQWNLPE
jgi:hypothetical protein